MPDKILTLNQSLDWQVKLFPAFVFAIAGSPSHVTKVLTVAKFRIIG